MIETVGLTRAYDGVRAVDDLKLEVPKGSVYGFLGRNGAGKTTTVKMLSTVLHPTSGTATVGGFDVQSEALKVRSIIGVIGEGTELARPFWTPMEYLRFFSRLQGGSDGDAKAELKEWLGRLDLAAHANRPIGGFSAGMRKRLELCRVFSRHPEVLLLDEPTKELDIPGKREIWEFLRDLATGEKVTLFLCSHDATEIEALCDRIAILRQGKLSFQGSKGDLPRTVFRIETGSPEQVQKYVTEHLPMASCSAIRNRLYVALREGMSPEGLKSSLQSAGLSIGGVAEVDAFDERVLAFL
ncbi:MAG: ABC transporter ATP-binding protein [Methanobacteriota archaeon]|nr:MAG: ABC transporter ATP-binding protein [Euryarchaeota archaeon]TMA00909.1 MAG: ABC transporter ATP-binding protein [Euryarchaeota archaeon]